MPTICAYVSPFLGSSCTGARAITQVPVSRCELQTGCDVAVICKVLKCCVVLAACVLCCFCSLPLLSCEIQRCLQKLQITTSHIEGKNQAQPRTADTAFQLNQTAAQESCFSCIILLMVLAVITHNNQDNPRLFVILGSKEKRGGVPLRLRGRPRGEQTES